AHRFEPSDAATREVLSHKPALAIWGMADQTLQPSHFIPLFNEAFPNGTTHFLEGVGHYCHEDAPEEVGKLIDEFIQKT
ncbi:MAG: alpha/beta fold hydrolase, partial [Cyclobacteriaceae bacterium]